MAVVERADRVRSLRPACCLIAEPMMTNRRHRHRLLTRFAWSSTVRRRLMPNSKRGLKMRQQARREAVVEQVPSSARARRASKPKRIHPLRQAETVASRDREREQQIALAPAIRPSSSAPLSPVPNINAGTVSSKAGDDAGQLHSGSEKVKTRGETVLTVSNRAAAAPVRARPERRPRAAGAPCCTSRPESRRSAAHSNA